MREKEVVRIVDSFTEALTYRHELPDEASRVSRGVPVIYSLLVERSLAAFHGLDYLFIAIVSQILLPKQLIDLRDPKVAEFGYGKGPQV